MERTLTMAKQEADNSDAARAKRVAREEIRKLETQIQGWRLVLRALDADAEIAGEQK
jgi:hypothetical protein